MPLALVTPSKSLRAQVDEIVSSSRLPASLRYPLRGIGWRHGELVLRDVVRALEGWIDDEERPFDAVPHLRRP